MELEIQKYLRSNGLNIEELASRGIYVKAHSMYPQILNFNYDQITAINGDPLVKECRALILNQDDNWNILARGYDRFFNYGQGSAAEINWSTSKVLAKLDGSYINLWWNPYEENWNIGTRGTPDASGEVNGFSRTFQELFWETFHALGYKLPRDKSITYIFELMRPENRVVCRYKEHRLVLHGMRSIEEDFNYQEYNHDILCAEAKGNNWEVVKAVKMNSIDEIIESCRLINPLDEEGYVVCDQINFNRVKVKSPQYLALHSMRDGFGPKRVLVMLRENSGDQWLEYFPEFADLYNKYKTRYDAIVGLLEFSYEKVKDIKDQKTFALAIKDLELSGALFQIRARRIKTIKEYLSNININTLMDYFDAPREPI
jgi:hypothetical protein